MREDIVNNGTIVVVGLGYVGIPLALLAERKGYKVIGVDINAERVELLNKRVAPFADQEIAEQLKNSSLEATMDFSRIKDALVIIICVPTPIHENNMPNLEPIENACWNIGRFLSKGQLVILESTVNPGVCENIVLPILEKESGLKCGKDFYLIHCPERINPGDKKWSVENINRVIGSFDEIGLQKAIDFYKSIISAEIKPMTSLKEAEAVKIVENAFRDINIAFVNELAISFSHLGIDVVNVINGAATKPFAFMPHYPGCGVGGHCIPVTPYYLIDYARQNGFHHEFLSLARKINNHMPKFCVDLLVSELRKKNITFAGTKVAVLGLAYKPDLDDDRGSPAYEIVKCVSGYGMEVAIYDPYITKDLKTTLEQTLRGARAAIIATAHSEFRRLTPEVFAENGVEIVIDGRNCLNKEAFTSSGVVYRGIGR